MDKLAEAGKSKPRAAEDPPKFFVPGDFIQRRGDTVGTKGVVISADKTNMTYRVYIDGDTEPVDLDASLVSAFAPVGSHISKKPAVSAAAAAAAATDGWVHHVTLTGAPGAGKSAAIDVIADAIRATGAYHVVTKPEVPTQVFASVGGFKEDWATNPELLVNLQSEIMRRQLQMDNDAYAAARMAHDVDQKPCIIIGDRCVKDGEAFASAEDWATTVKANNMTAEGLDRHIGLVIMLETTAINLPHLYDFGPGSSNPQRHTTPDAARAVHSRLLKVFDFSNPARRYRAQVPSAANFNDKLVETFGAIAGYVGMTTDLTTSVLDALTTGPSALAKPLDQGGQGPADPATLAAAAAAAKAQVGPPSPADDAAFRSNLLTRLQDGATPKEIADIFKASGHKIDFGDTSGSKAVDELKAWADGRGASGPGTTRDPAAVLAAYTGLRPSMVIKVDQGELPMLLINLFTPTVRSLTDDALGLRPLGKLTDTAHEETTELSPGLVLHTKVAKDYYKLPAPKSESQYRQAAGHLERYGGAAAAFGVVDLENHHKYVDRICRYMSQFSLQAVLDFDLSFRRMHHAKVLPMGFLDTASEILMHHLLIPAATATKDTATDKVPRGRLAGSNSQLAERVSRCGKLNDEHGQPRPVCFIWNLTAGACRDPCPRRFIHKCGICQDSHRAVDCPLADESRGLSGRTL
jgi:hypothetical protein